jgi:branched-chain amino acid transport system substrate-binding protein
MKLHEIERRLKMEFRKLLLTTAAAATTLTAALAPATSAQAAEQFFPLLVYRTGPYAPNGTPFANGIQDYFKLVNERGGINGVKVIWEECETGYATAKGVECYERLKNKNGGASLFQPLSTGITFALTEKAPIDKIPLLTAGYGRSESQDGGIFKWNFPITGTYWVAADVLVKHVANLNGGLNKLKGKKIALVYHDSPYGKEPIPLLEKRAAMHGFELQLLPVTHPGVEQKSQWLQIRRNRPDYVFLWGWGVMNSTAIKEAVATGFPREKMYGVWWSGAEPDVEPAGAGAKGYNALALQHGPDEGSAVVKEIMEKVYAKGNGTGPKEKVGEVLYMRGLVAGLMATEAVRAAQNKFGKGKHMTGEQVRWGLENLKLSDFAVRSLGFGGVVKDIYADCNNHMGAAWSRIQTWDGKKWSMTSDWIEADYKVLNPLVKEWADKYGAEKGIKRRPASDCNA